jgi:hypothetical protein
MYNLAMPDNRISEITRRTILDFLLLRTVPFNGSLDLISFLKRVWPLKSMPSTDHRFRDAEGDIWQHAVNNSDWDYSELLYRRLDILECPDETFGKFLEACVHPLVFRDRDECTKVVDSVNKELRNDGFCLSPKEPMSGRDIYLLVDQSDGTAGTGHAYEVVLSFAGQDRQYVERVAAILTAQNVSLFYDAYEEATLWGKDLVEHLHEVYSGSARYCVMFISRHYAEQIWPTHERRSAFERAVAEKEEYILPARFDDTEIPGLVKTICYIDLRRKTPEEFSALILEKLGRSKTS